jgi:epoxyqueuosine reductase
VVGLKTPCIPCLCGGFGCSLSTTHYFLGGVLTAEELTTFIKQTAPECGFDLVGITTAAPFLETEARLLEHIAAGRIDGLAWFTPERARVSADPSKLMSQVRSIISLGCAYLTTAPGLAEDGDRPHGKVARYAWGKDYHEVLKAKMQTLFERIKEFSGAEEGRLLVDTARIVDRAVGQRAGLGFFGKNTNLINKKLGSYFFLAEILTDLELIADEPATGTCGKCTRCLDVCPTDAFDEAWQLHNDKCISYLTIEKRDSIPLELRANMGQWVFGCDLCQEVCPYNKKVIPLNHAEFVPLLPGDSAPDLLEWLEITADEQSFRQKFKGTPLLRPKRSGLRRNIAVALGNTANPAVLTALRAALATEPDPMVREHLQWAINQLTNEA